MDRKDVIKYGPLKYDLNRLIHERRLRIVILDCPYNTMESEETRKLFGRVVALKIRGYRSEYPYGVLPVSTLDFIAQHLLICEEQERELHPVIGMKSVTLSNCSAFNQKFPALDLVAEQEDDQWEKAILSYIRDASRKKQEVAYASSLTANKEYREDPTLKRFIWDISAFFFIRFFLLKQINAVISGATIRFKIQKMLDFVGHSELTLNGKKLPPMPCKSFFNEPIRLMTLHEPKKQALQWSHQFDSFWANRLTIAEEIEENQAAA